MTVSEPSPETVAITMVFLRPEAAEAAEAEEAVAEADADARDAGGGAGAAVVVVVVDSNLGRKTPKSVILIPKAARSWS